MNDFVLGYMTLSGLGTKPVEKTANELNLYTTTGVRWHSCASVLFLRSILILCTLRESKQQVHTLNTIAYQPKTM